ncbi:hypothetical protein WJX75_002632 [Coccomyxa subellipsoidea]|uniref:Uncharacterized protein n=1 Tax=Coccomyxa subellipsoidea TaxID=248742 RepID=A0ABR2YV48_9CHLO
MAAPVIFSLLALLRRESVASVQSARVVAARFGMALQLQLLEEGRPLTLHATALAESIGVLRDSGDAQSMQLANSAVAAFQKAAGSAKIAKDAGPETQHAPADHTIDIHSSGQQQEQHASLLGRSLYRPPGSLANGSIAEEEGVSRSPSLGPPSRNSSTLSGRSSLASNPLLRSPTDFSTKISPLQRPSHARTLVVAQHTPSRLLSNGG